MLKDKNLEAHMDAAVMRDALLRSITLPEIYSRESNDILKQMLTDGFISESQETVQKLIAAYIAYLNEQLE
jgi:hypothetical protein